MDDLLNILKNNALETPENLAKMLDRPEAEVKAQIEAYEKSGVIRGYQTIVNRDLLELNDVDAVIEVRTTPEREGGFNTIAKRISRFPEVTSVYLMSGGYDLLVFVSGSNLKDVAGFVSDKLATIDGILSTATHFTLKTYKEQGVMMNSEEEDERLKVSP